MLRSIQQQVRFDTDANGIIGLIDPATGQKSGVLRSSKLNQAIRRLRVGLPASMVFYGDSTGNETDEWVYLLSGHIATAFPALTLNYRSWNDTTQQYDNPTILSTGTAGAAHVVTGSGTNTWRGSIADASYTEIVGDIDVRFKLSLNGSLPSATATLGGKWGAAPQRSWFFGINTSGTLELQHSANGTDSVIHTSTVALAGAQLTDAIWVRAALDVDNGATGNTCTFYTSTDGATWTALGTASVKAGVSSIANSTTTTQFIGRGGAQLVQQDHDFHFYEMEVYASLDGSARVVDIDFGAFYYHDVASAYVFIDDVGNTVTMVINSSGSFAGSPRLAIYNAGTSGAAISYAHDATRYPKLTIGSPVAVFISFSHNETLDIEYRTDYKTLTDKLLITNPDVAICAVLQNPRISPAAQIKAHALRLQQVSEFASSQGFDVLDVYSNWQDSYTDTDGIHPIAAGSAHWANLGRATLGV